MGRMGLDLGGKGFLFLSWRNVDTMWMCKGHGVPQLLISTAETSTFQPQIVPGVVEPLLPSGLSTAAALDAVVTAPTCTRWGSCEAG